MFRNLKGIENYLSERDLKKLDGYTEELFNYLEQKEVEKEEKKSTNLFSKIEFVDSTEEIKNEKNNKYFSVEEFAGLDFPVKITRHSNYYVIEVESPGLYKDNISVEIEENTIKFNFTKQKLCLDGDVIFDETSEGTCKFNITPKEEIDFTHEIDAEYKKGVLFVEVPFVQKTPYTVEIK